MKDLLSDFDSRLFDILSKSNSNMFFYCIDMKNNVAHWSESAKDYFSLPSTRLSPASLWADRIHPDDIKGHDKKIEALTSGETPYLNCEYRIMNKAGDYIWANCRGYMTYDEDGAPQVMAGYVCNMGQITKIDPGTGMWNAYAFRNNLSAMLERGESGVAMMIDIRNFKRINAKFGYDFGDTVLYTIGHRLLDICEKRATVYRVAGTQFAMFMSGGREEAISLWSDIEEYVQNITVGGKKINIHFVTGVTFFPQDGQHFDQINSNLTYTVAAAKQAERKDIVYYSGELVMQRNRLVRMNEALQNSITNGFKGFSIVFQPVIDASTGALHGAEVLLRWEDDDFPKASPVEFIPVLEHSEKIIPVGRWVVDEALRYVSKWNNSDMPHKLPHVNINFSYIQFSDETLKDYIISKLNEYKLPHNILIAELTESCRVEYTEDLAAILQSLRDEGISIALDDFGTGYASLMLLKDTPTDIVKLDHTMTRSIKDRPKDRSLVEFIIKYCIQAGIQVCTEGVENKDIQDIVKSAGTSFLQGYLYDKPLPPDEFFEKYIK